MAELTRYAALSIATALATLGLKFYAWSLTDSVGLFSDALESIVNLVAALVAYRLLKLSIEPADEEHTFGHDKAEYLSSGIEGGLVLCAALGIVAAAVPRLLSPQPLQKIDVGLVLSTAASVLNGLTALTLLRAGRRHRSLLLEADGHHLMSDVWSSVGVLAGVACAAATGWLWLDPAVALVAGAWVGWTGIHVLGRAMAGLLDVSLPPEALQKIEAVLAHYREQGMDFHALRTRVAGRHSFIQLHVLVPGDWTVSQGHALLDELEHRLHEVVPGARLHTHLEPLEEPASFEDVDLERRFRRQA